MKKFKVLIGNNESITESSNELCVAIQAIRNTLIRLKLKTGETKTVTFSITRLAFTKQDRQIRRDKKEKARQEWEASLKPPQVGDIRYTQWGRVRIIKITHDGQTEWHGLALLPEIGDVIVNPENRKVLGRIIKVSDTDNTFEMKPCDPTALTKGMNTFNVSLEEREFRREIYIHEHPDEFMKSQAQKSLEELGL